MQVALLAHGVSPHVTSAMTRTRSAIKTSVVRNGKQLLCVSLYTIIVNDGRIGYTMVQMRYEKTEHSRA